MGREPRQLFSVDDHICEPADTWTARVSARFREQAPHVVREGDRETWFVATQTHAVGMMYGNVCRKFSEFPALLAARA